MRVASANTPGDPTVGIDAAIVEVEPLAKIVPAKHNFKNFFIKSPFSKNVWVQFRWKIFQCQEVFYVFLFFWDYRIGFPVKREMTGRWKWMPDQVVHDRKGHGFPVKREMTGGWKWMPNQVVHDRKKCHIRA